MGGCCVCACLFMGRGAAGGVGAADSGRHITHKQPTDFWLLHFAIRFWRAADAMRGFVQPKRLTFTSANWGKPQQATLTGKALAGAWQGHWGEASLARPATLHCTAHHHQAGQSHCCCLTSAQRPTTALHC